MIERDTVETRAAYNPIDAQQHTVFNETRMSRLSHPRATAFAMILLAVVFLLFGVFASAIEPAYTPAPNTFEGAAVIVSSWIFG